MTRHRINKALRPLGLEIQSGKGYCYFTSRRFQAQIGESVYIPHLSDLTISGWVDCARNAIRQHRKTGYPFARSKCFHNKPFKIELRRSIPIDSLTPGEFETLLLKTPHKFK